jgi:hypothetical protein
MRDLNLGRGRIVSVAELYQRPTYAGVLAGKPGPRLNQSMIDQLLVQAKRYGCSLEPRIVAPSAEAFATELPPVACIAVLESGGFGGEPCSSLTVAWFQEHLAPPFPQEVERYVRSLDWEAVAVEWCP